MKKARNLLAAVAMLAVASAGSIGLLGSGAGHTGVAQAAAPLDSAKVQTIAQTNLGKIRRESGPQSQGPAPLTGPASVTKPQVAPNFGTNYRANTDTQSPNLAQQEPSIAVNPTNPLNVVAAAKDERAGSNTKQIWIYTSMDGGVTWINQQFPLAAPASQFSSDVIVSFADDGVCYVTALPYSNSAVSTDGIQVARSNDGCMTFSTGVHLPGTSDNSDKEWTWIDNTPTSPYYHRMYDAWRNFGSGPDILFNYSIDRGATWSNASTGVTSAVQFPMPVSLPNGDVLITFYGTNGDASYVRSTNGGLNFGAVGVIDPISDPNCPPDDSGCGIWRLSAIPATAVDPRNGDLVVTWAAGSQGTATILDARSTDNGMTWSQATPLAPPGVANTYQVEPWVTSDEQGIMHAIWYDDRQNPNTSVFNIYYSQSTDDGATWSQAVAISTATSDLRIGIPSSYNAAAGDYINVTASQGNVYAAWTDTRSGTGEDIYVVRGVFNPNMTPTAAPTGGTATATATASASATTQPSSTRTQTTAPSVTSTSISTVVATATATATATSTSTAIATSTATTVASSTASSVSSGTSQATVTAGSTSTPTAVPTTCTISFIDVPPGSTFYAYIECLACRGIVSGYADGTFRPSNLVTRGQIAKIVDLSSGGTGGSAGPQRYQDVGRDTAFYSYINELTERGVMGGYACGGPGEPCVAPANLPYFRYGDNATRGQISKIVSNAAGFSDPPSGQSYQDVPAGSPFYVWIQRLTTRNVMGGYACGGPGEPCVSPANLPYFRYGVNTSRGQVAKIDANTFYQECQPQAR